MVLLCAATCFVGCKQKSHLIEIEVTNNADLNRKQETITIPVDSIRDLIAKYGIDNIQILEDDKVLVSQPVDTNGDSTVDEIIFQTDFSPNEKKKILLIVREDTSSVATPKVTTYARFVPERIDDFAWENDRVAFRTYGPKAQQITESGQPGGTLTSGMDCWLKRVDYPVIDKWYKMNLDTPGYYHIDHGEGYDPYHVGNSRGCGGIGILDMDSLYVSKNFVSHRIISNGPIRSIFELKYDAWTANGRKVNERKVISLDLGSNLTRYEVHLQSDQPLPNVTIGVALHAGKGNVAADTTLGWFSYWEPVDDAQIGTAIVLDPKIVQSTLDQRGAAIDQNQLLVVAKPLDNDPLVYYAGFGWTKSDQFKTAKDWEHYLSDFATRRSSPIILHFGH